MGIEYVNILRRLNSMKLPLRHDHSKSQNEQEHCCDLNYNLFMRLSFKLATLSASKIMMIGPPDQTRTSQDRLIRRLQLESLRAVGTRWGECDEAVGLQVTKLLRFAVLVGRNWARLTGSWNCTPSECSWRPS